MPGSSTKSVILATRISKVQFALLSKVRAANKMSPLIRVLLELYLNGRLAAFNIEVAVQEEMDKAMPPASLGPKA
jgi:hypothetical protein